MNIYIDLETIPGQSVLAGEIINSTINKKISELKAPSNYGEIKAAEWVGKKTIELNDGFEEAHLKTSFDGGLGEICCIGVKIGDGDVRSFLRTKDGYERDVLENFVSYVSGLVTLNGGSNSKIQWIGHNVIDFDLPFLYKRLVVNNVNPSFDVPVNARHGFNAFDTMKAWGGFKGMISQDNLCKILDLETKQGMDGSRVYLTWLDEKYDEIGNYCESDVKTVVALHKRLTFNNPTGDI